jgi:hypothetical protein
MSGNTPGLIGNDLPSTLFNPIILYLSGRATSGIESVCSFPRSDSSPQIPEFLPIWHIDQLISPEREAQNG